MCLWVLSEVVCARLLGSDKCLKHCMSKKLKLRSLSFSYQRLFPNSPFLPQVSYWLSVSKHLARVNIFFVFVLKVEEIWFGFLDLCTLLQPCIVTQDIRVSAYTLAIKVQNSEALKTAGSWKCNISLAIFKDSWQRDFNTIQCHTLEEKLNFAENTQVQLPISVDKQNCWGNGLTSTE